MNQQIDIEPNEKGIRNEQQIVDNKPSLTEGFDIEAEQRLDEQSANSDGFSLTTFAKYASNICSPLLMPTYCVAMGMWLTIVSQSPENTRITASFVILLITGLIPMAMIFGLIKAGYVSNFAISNRHQRFIPMGATSLCYIAATIYLHRVHAPDWMAMIFVGAFCAGIVCAVMSKWWKISAHGTSAGVLIGLMVRFAVSDLSIVPILPWIIAAVIIGGIIGVSRVVLNAHNTGQYIAGEVLGGICVFISTGLPLPFVSEHIMPI